MVGKKSMKNENILEKRKFERYRVNGLAYAAIGPDFSRMGHIINISRSGLCFSYIQQADAPPYEKETYIQISDNVETLCEMPFVTISDTIGDLADPHSSVKIRHHRGCFGKLSRDQLASLAGFLGEKTPFKRS